MRYAPLIEARGFTGRELKVLLPDFSVGAFTAAFTGLGELSCREDSIVGDGIGDGISEELFDVGPLMLRTLEGVLSDFAVLGLFMGVL